MPEKMVSIKIYSNGNFTFLYKGTRLTRKTILFANKQEALNYLRNIELFPTGKDTNLFFTEYIAPAIYYLKHDTKFSDKLGNWELEVDFVNPPIQQNHFMYDSQQNITEEAIKYMEPISNEILQMFQQAQNSGFTPRDFAYELQKMVFSCASILEAKKDSK